MACGRWVRDLFCPSFSLGIVVTAVFVRFLVMFLTCWYHYFVLSLGLAVFGIPLACFRWRVFLYLALLNFLLVNLFRLQWVVSFPWTVPSFRLGVVSGFFSSLPHLVPPFRVFLTLLIPVFLLFLLPFAIASAPLATWEYYPCLFLGRACFCDGRLPFLGLC